MAAKNRVAVVDGDPEWGEFLVTLLGKEGYEVTHFPSAGKFFDAIIKARFALAVLDMRLPGMHGREVIRVLRANAETRHMLLVGVSAQDVSSADTVAALEAGADEYLCKPVDAEFFVVRIASLLRRAAVRASPEPERLCAGGLVIFPELQEVHLDGLSPSLTNLEFRLLEYFLRNANRVLTRQLMLEQVWGVKTPLDTRTVDKHVEALRRKLGKFGERFETVVKVGYVFKV
ncbi:MAG TPA: DNA-binding response regulator [Elusimicrobia bacterium]|nr:DNA-binding response regulator [Elusimicrobiota bacterium]HBT60880.1 DNA-binding response regulator [Elusimicrobiota bacterium]